ncbi:hypothetical protein CEF21_07020 [Bacillus sp. FJAT-42376]|uniref:hypothetical protein n=1 Tax=Bacillus sp. FJAT-42376 TaxID=2014076 RepID=UPI000F4EB536|nr:hypothetical protein [Bacillus sp. FJAT-42376]AZB42060.1 hypothetical protein CEF21_07020 [Bacillus sp. FJAT-42376]
MQDITIEVDANTLENRTNITGNIYFMIDYYRYFPEHDWSDFVVIILSWWIKSYKGIMVSEVGRTYEFDFMDGTPTVFAKKINESQVEILFCEDGLQKVDFSGVFGIQQLRDSLLSASKKIIRGINRKQWSSKEIDELIHLTISLEKYPI